jgi:hypothetical protein
MICPYVDRQCHEDCRAYYVWYDKDSIAHSACQRLEKETEQ